MASTPASSMKPSAVARVKRASILRSSRMLPGHGTCGEMSDGRRCDFVIWIDSAEQMVNDGVEVAAITESRQRHLEGIEAIEQVGAEAPFGNGLVEAWRW